MRRAVLVLALLAHASMAVVRAAEPAAAAGLSSDVAARLHANMAASRRADTPAETPVAAAQLSRFQVVKDEAAAADTPVAVTKVQDSRAAVKWDSVGTEPSSGDAVYTPFKPAAQGGKAAKGAAKQQHKAAAAPALTPAPVQQQAAAPKKAEVQAAAVQAGDSAASKQRSAATSAAKQASFSTDMSPKAGQLSPSILIMGSFDWGTTPDANGKPWSRCLDMVWRAKRLNRGNRLNFVPTHHWLPNDGGGGVKAFCYQYNKDGQLACHEWDREAIQRYQDGMQVCFEEAFRQGVVPYIRPHLDDGLGRGTWRNGLLFSPLQQYGGFSYKEIMIDPLVNAMAGALKTAKQEGILWAPADRSRPVVYFALQGEMSATIMRFTKDWASLIPDIRSRLPAELTDVKVGIGLNFNELDATEPGTPSQQKSLFGLVRVVPQSVPSIDSSAVYDLVANKIDFLGISAYAPYTGPGMALSEFENSAFNVADSLRRHGGGVDLASLVNSGKLELHYSEFGIGGGREGNGEAARSATGVARKPWAGLAGPYSYDKDPWRQGENGNFRREFYRKVLQWLSQPGIKTHNVSEVFVWGMASWDLFGTYPDSMNYRDRSIVRSISNHNMKVVVALTLQQSGPEAAAKMQAFLEQQEKEYGSVDQ